jgi:hypothetical protein
MTCFPTLNFLSGESKFNFLMDPKEGFHDETLCKKIRSRL